MDCKVQFVHVFFWEMTSRPSFILFFHKHLGSISFSQGNQLKRESVFGVSKLRFNVNCDQINETTEISTDYEDSQKNGLIVLCVFSLTHLDNPRHQISNYNLEWHKPSFHSLLYSSQILFEDTTCMHFHARYYINK